MSAFKLVLRLVVSSFRLRTSLHTAPMFPGGDERMCSDPDSISSGSCSTPADLFDKRPEVDSLCIEVFLVCSILGYWLLNIGIIVANYALV